MYLHEILYFNSRAMVCHDLSTESASVRLMAALMIAKWRHTYGVGVVTYDILALVQIVTPQ